MNKSQLQSILTYLQQPGQDHKVVRDPLWGDIIFPSPFDKIIESPAFMHLMKVRQLGPAVYLYPGALHTRYAHSLGVFYVARRLIYAYALSLYQRSEEAELSAVPFSLGGLKAYLASALLHDIGHYPLAHMLEGSTDIISHHEKRSARLICSDPVIGEALASHGVCPEDVASIIHPQTPPKNLSEEETKFLSQFLSGPIDPDKLDYLNRDSHFCGVVYGLQDLSFILSQVHSRPTGSSTPGFALSYKALTSLESVLFSKYLMYKNVYSHRAVAVLSALARRGVVDLLSSSLLTALQLEDLGDDELYDLACKADKALSGRGEDENLARKVSSLSGEEKKLAKRGSALLASSAKLGSYKALFTIPWSPAEHSQARTDARSLQKVREFESSFADILGLGDGQSLIVEPVIHGGRPGFECDLFIEKGRGDGEFCRYDELTKSSFSRPLFNSTMLNKTMGEALEYVLVAVRLDVYKARYENSQQGTSDLFQNDLNAFREEWSRAFS